jgi:hypothetical protein
MRALLYHWLDWLTDRLIEMMEKLEPVPPRKQELDYHVSSLPAEILAIVRVTWYCDGKPDEVDQVVLHEDGQNGYDAFAALVQTALKKGANVSIRSGYKPEDLGIFP